MKKYDIIVVGAGHAGIEAAHIGAKVGCSVLLFTLDIDSIGKLSCNPAVGGVSKGHLVKEVDAMGGLIAKITDSSAIGYRRLNKSKGKAVWATRAQVDKFVYPKVARSFLESQSNIDFIQAKVKDFVFKGKAVCGVETNFGQIFKSSSVVVCAGTFLKSTIHIGMNSFKGGRLYEESSDNLFKAIKETGIILRHFKTGTCARLDKRTIDFSKMIEQPPERDVEPFSFSNKKIIKNQLSCYIAHTNDKTHKIILKNLKHSPLYSGKIKSRGVRYCPSLEDKIVRFSDKNKHQIFIEPEGRDSNEVYPNGISSSLPFSVQQDFIHSVKGLENAKILRPGYGIEHGVIDPRELSFTLEAKKIKGLYFAGQVNGTTGYEEAAAQGFVAGLNAALKVKKLKPFILRRSEAFIGVLISDLVTKGTDEPYRMFTSRSEYRLSLREANADLRLAPMAYSLGLIDKESYERSVDKKKAIVEGVKYLRAKRVMYKGKKSSVADILKRPEIKFKTISKFIDSKMTDNVVCGEIETLIKYEGFLKRELQSVKVFDNFKKVKIPKSLDLDKISSLSGEIKEKLKIFKPLNLEEALNISGVTPAAALTIYRFIEARKPTKSA